MNMSLSGMISSVIMVFCWAIFGKWSATQVFPEVMASQFESSVPYIMVLGVVTGLFSFLLASGVFFILTRKKA